MNKYFWLLLFGTFILNGCGGDVKNGDPKPVDPATLPPGMKPAGMSGAGNANTEAKAAKVP